MRVNTKLIQSLDPCRPRLNNYLKHYKDWSGTWSEFFELDKISTKDKLWVFMEDIKGIEKQQREFAFLCTGIAVEKSSSNAIKELFTYILLIYESGMLNLLYGKDYHLINQNVPWTKKGNTYRAVIYSADKVACLSVDCSDPAKVSNELKLEIAKYVMARRGK